MKYVIEGKDVYSQKNSIPGDGVIVDTESVYEIGTFCGNHIGRPAEIKDGNLKLDTSKDYHSEMLNIPLGQIHSIKKIERCIHLREITTHNNEKFLVCACDECPSFLEHFEDEDCETFCKYRRTE